MTGTRRAAASVGMAKWQLEIEKDNKIIFKKKKKKWEY